MSICLPPNQLSSGEVILNNGDFLGQAFLLQHFRLATSDVALQGLNRLKRGMVADLNRTWIGFCYFSILLSVKSLARL